MKNFGVVIDICFVVDIVIAFRTTYIDLHTGQEELKVKALAKNYLIG